MSVAPSSPNSPPQGARVRAVTRTPKTARFPDGVEVVELGGRRTPGSVGGVPQFPSAR